MASLPLDLLAQAIQMLLVVLVRPVNNSNILGLEQSLFTALGMETLSTVLSTIMQRFENLLCAFFGKKKKKARRNKLKTEVAIHAFFKPSLLNSKKWVL